MVKCKEVELTRSMLLGARIRFSPTGASIRNQAIEIIIEQSLASVCDNSGLTEDELKKIVTLSGNTPLLRVSDLNNGLENLLKDERIMKYNDGKKVKYKLDENNYNTISQTIKTADDLLTKIVLELFNPISNQLQVYKSAFIQVLCLIFSVISESNVRIILRLKDGLDDSEAGLLLKSIYEVINSCKIPDPELFESGIKKFFHESKPKFDNLKWNMAQNYYIVKALGIDSTADILSTSVFENAIIYCDTNVLIGGLTPDNRHHNSIKELAKACEDIGIQLAATHNTLEELKGVLQHHADLLKKIIDKLPNEIIPKVQDFLLHTYLIEKDQNPNITVDEIVKRYENPIESLSEICFIKKIDDEWFNNAHQDKKTNQIAESLSKTYFMMRHRKKSKSASMHDAILLNWILKENINNANKSWLVTLDLTLAEWSTLEDNKDNNVITLDAFLQWMTPITLQNANSDTLAKLFSSAICSQLFPVENFFSLQDFQVFEDMNIEILQLPSEDVEACVREIRTKGTKLDPSKAEDREKLDGIIQKFFADPSRKYKITLEEERKKNQTLFDLLEKEKQDNKNTKDQVSLLTDQITSLKDIVTAKGNDLDNANSCISSLTEDLNMIKEDIIKKDKLDKWRNDRKILKNSTISILCSGIITWTIFVFILFIFVIKNISNFSFYAVILNSLTLFGLPSIILVPIFKFILGEDKMNLLKNWNKNEP